MIKLISYDQDTIFVDINLEPKVVQPSRSSRTFIPHTTNMIFPLGYAIFMPQYLRIWLGVAVLRNKSVGIK